MSSETLHSASRLDSLSNSNSLVRSARRVDAASATVTAASATSTPLNTSHNISNLHIAKIVQPPVSFSSFNLLRTISNEPNNESAVNLSPTVNTNANDLKTQPQNNTVPQQQQNPTNANEENTNSLRIGDYILFETSSQSTSNDTFNSAFNVKKNQFFYWKVS